jgi:hypothetical protein
MLHIESFDPRGNAGELEGAEIMDGLLGLLRDTRARVVSEVD